MSLLNKIRNREASVAVIGLGYVGFPLAVEFAKTGFRTIALDIDIDKVHSIQNGQIDIIGADVNDLQEVLKTGNLIPTTDFSELAKVDTISICVPTPLSKTHDPDLSFIVSAVDEISKYLHPDHLVVLESTTYPGTVEEVVKPKLEADGLRAGQDFFLAFSPERVDPGNFQWVTRNIPKVVGGVDERSTEVAKILYEQIVETVVPVSSATVAETVKLFENTFRAVNIGLVNELALMCSALGVNVWEVIDAAKTKPFGFMPFYPGPGLGGHCIPIDPFYLSWKARQSGFESRFIELAGAVNAAMPGHVVKRVAEALTSQGKSLRGANVHLFGLSYKANVGDTRESPAVDIALLLHDQGAVISYSDPFVTNIDQGGLKLTATEPDVALSDGIDCVVITTAHDDFNYSDLVKCKAVIVDTRNALKDFQGDRIFRL
tara:strand:- start:204 stop:1499 length:1296 start_codon:yes stop_codon:yes gene_type:complete